MKAYTKYKLTERQLRVLSQLFNNRLRDRFGPTLDVLIRKNLVGEHYTYGVYYITDEGRNALAEASREGW